MNRSLKWEPVFEVERQQNNVIGLIDCGKDLQNLTQPLSGIHAVLPLIAVRLNTVAVYPYRSETAKNQFFC